MGKYIAVLFCLLGWVSQSDGQEILSPDKKVKTAFVIKDGRASFKIWYANKPVLEESALGLIRSDEDFETSLHLINSSPTTLVNDSYHIKNAKKSFVHYQASRKIFHLQNVHGKKIDIVFQVSNDGVAFRYSFPDRSADDKTINAEATAYNFDQNTRAWLQPMSVAKTGWQQCNPAYEEGYMQDVPVGTPSKVGWVYPALFRSDDTWLLFTEASLDSNYCGTRLINDSASSIYKVGFPDPREVFTGRGLLPHSTLPWNTPWRIIIVGSLKTIIESTLGTDLAKPAIEIDSSFIKPGRASWSWINSKDDSIVYSEQKRYIDYAHNMRWEYCLIDADWDTKIGYEKVKELADYAATKNVGLLLWYNSAGDWNTTPYHPRSMLLTHEQREREFARLKTMGIKGVKIDFFGGDGQSMIKYYHDILFDAAKYQLLLNFHGATLPRGWARTYPHLMSTEAVKGFEMVTFDQRAADNEATHCAVLPYTRNAFDPMDFTPMNLNKVYTHVQRRTTSAFELALSVLFLSGIQHYAESPTGMSMVPEYVKSFLMDLPTHWDDVKFIDGYPGKFVIVARKSGNRWYVCGINGENIEKDLTFSLSFLKSKTASLITDGDQTGSFVNKTISLSKSAKTSVVMKPQGGFVMVVN